ncbi:MAG: tetratricopeptide repeat protein, partial [Cyanobacteria bacterium J06632_22]
MVLVVICGSVVKIPPTAARITIPQQVSHSKQDSEVDSLERVEYLYQEISRLYNAGRYGEAIPLAEEALAIDLTIYGQHHPYTAYSLIKLARLYEAIEDLDNAESFYQQALSI